MDKALRWEKAQKLEMGFWNKWFDDTGLDEVNKRLDYGHMSLYMPFLYKWLGFNLSEYTVIDVGCGPCGLAPWIRCKERVGIEPLADWFREKGVNYEILGYNQVICSSLEDLNLDKVFDLVICINVLDHVRDRQVFLKKLSNLVGRFLFLCYDVRFKDTDLHPHVISVDEVRSVIESCGLELMYYDTFDKGVEREAVKFTQCEFWKRL